MNPRGNIKILGLAAPTASTSRKPPSRQPPNGIGATLAKVTDYADIASHNIIGIPGLVVEDRVILFGRVPTARQVKELLAPLAV